MDHWAYRLIEHEDTDGRLYYGVHEVYFKRGKVFAWTENHIGPTGSTPEEVLEALSCMLVDCESSRVLGMANLEQARNRWYRRLWRWIEWQWLELRVWFERRK